MVTQKTDEVAEQEEVLEFARYGGPGTIMYPSPRPTDVRDLSLPAMRWVQVDPAYRFSGVFARDKKNKVFETVKSGASPDDLDLSIDPQFENLISTDQRELIRTIVLSIQDPFPPEWRSAIEIANLLSDTGTGISPNVAVTLDYLRTRHRPFLLALQGVEKRYQKRKFLLGMVKKQLDRIEALPGK